MWIPRWLGETYARLYLEFGLEAFTLSNAVKVIGRDEKWVNVAFSRLHKLRLLYLFERSRPRLYRVVSPEAMILVLSGRIRNLDKVRQERYLQLVIDASLHLMRNYRLTSICLYGSVARGTARRDSDVDLLVVSDDFSGSLASRVEHVLQDLERKVSGEVERLRKYEVDTGLSIYPLRREEVLRLPPILLDLTEDGIVLYDEGSFLERTLTRLKARLSELNAKRVFIGEDSWYWDLKPDYKFGEVIEL
jgi:predicted nucleotidyltransferase